jgi:hypothetical protein
MGKGREGKGGRKSGEMLIGKSRKRIVPEIIISTFYGFEKFQNKKLVGKIST